MVRFAYANRDDGKWGAGGSVEGSRSSARPQGFREQRHGGGAVVYLSQDPAGGIGDSLPLTFSFCHIPVRYQARRMSLSRP